MADGLKPREGFSWDRVTWGRPDSPPSIVCSYCAAVLPEASVPLMMCMFDGHAAQFCAKCQREWFGMEGAFDDDPIEDWIRPEDRGDE